MWKKAIYRISAVAVFGTTVLLASEIAHADTRGAPLLKRTLITPPLVIERREYLGGEYGGYATPLGDVACGAVNYSSRTLRMTVRMISDGDGSIYSTRDVYPGSIFMVDSKEVEGLYGDFFENSVYCKIEVTGRQVDLDRVKGSLTWLERIIDRETYQDTVRSPKIVIEAR